MFGSELDLKAHQVEVHGADMSSRDKRDVRRVQADFEFDDVGVSGGGRRGRRDREREPPPVQIQGQAQGQGQGRAGRRREAFGGHLSVAEGAQTMQSSSVPSGRASPIRDDVDPLVAECVSLMCAYPTTLTLGVDDKPPSLRGCKLWLRIQTMRSLP